MYEIAKKERHDILTSIFLLGPAMTALFFVAIVCSYKSVSSLHQKGFFDLIVEFEYEVSRLIPQLSVLGNRFWTEFERGYMFVSASSGTAIIFLVKKSKLNNLRTRIKEVSQYLPDTNFSILRFNR